MLNYTFQQHRHRVSLVYRSNHYASHRMAHLVLIGPFQTTEREKHYL